MDDINKYIENIEFLDFIDSNKVFPNSSKDHAEALVSQLIIGAQRNIKILSSNLDMYDKKTIIDSLNNLHDKNPDVEITIVLDGDPVNLNPNNEFLRICQTFNNCTARRSTTKFGKHIVTRDGVAYRLCENLTTHKAKASFNDEQGWVGAADDQVFNESILDRLEHVA